MIAVILLSGAALFSASPQPPRCLLVFEASWCGPCQAMLPDVHKLIAEGYDVRIADVDQYRALARSFGVSAVPEVMVIEQRDGAIMAAFRPGAGRRRPDELRAIVRTWGVRRNY